MFRYFLVFGMLFLPGSGFCATVDGALVSIDMERHKVTLESGVILNLTADVVLDGLVPGQLVRLTYTDDTVDVTAIDVLENSPPPEATDNTSTVVDNAPVAGTDDPTITIPAVTDPAADTSTPPGETGSSD